MKNNKNTKNKLVVYQAKNGAIELRSDMSKETVWATQAQIANIFDIERSVVTKHIGNLFKTSEINEKSNVQKMHIANSDKPVSFYSLDIILSVGYRANSQKAIEFRKWATKVLRQHVIAGYTINPNRIKSNYSEFMTAVEDIKALLPADVQVDNVSVLELISAFADTWLSLDAYDKDELITKGETKKAVVLTAKKLTTTLLDFKQVLEAKGEAGELFGLERQKDSVAGIVGNVMQSFNGHNVYPTVEEKAANLLYFMVKNHPFVDGNKRSGAYAFVWFLQKAGILDKRKLTPPALTAITLLIAESAPKNKERMISLVLRLLKK